MSPGRTRKRAARSPEPEPKEGLRDRHGLLVTHDRPCLAPAHQRQRLGAVDARRAHAEDILRGRIAGGAADLVAAAERARATAGYPASRASHVAVEKLIDKLTRARDSITLVVAEWRPHYDRSVVPMSPNGHDVPC